MSTRFKVIKIGSHTLTPTDAVELSSLFDEWFEKDGLDKGEMQQFVIARRPAPVPEGAEPTGETVLMAEGAAVTYITEAELAAALSVPNQGVTVIGMKQVAVKCPQPALVETAVVPLKPKAPVLE